LRVMFPIRILTVKRNIRKSVAYTFKCKDRKGGFYKGIKQETKRESGGILHNDSISGGIIIPFAIS